MSATKRTMVKVAGATDEMKALAVEFYSENQLSNEHDTRAKKARKSLFQMMLDAGLKQFVATFVSGRNSVGLNVEIAEGRATSKVNMERLRKIVGDDEKLLSLCTMTKTDVVAHFGTLVADSVCEQVSGREDVQVKAVK